MSALSKISRGVKHLAPAIIHEGMDTALTIGASEAFGYIHGKYREKATIRGIPVNLVAGVAGKALCIVAETFYGGAGWCKYADSIANAGIGSYFFADGVARGTKAAGRKIYILESGKMAPAQLGDLRATDVVGEIPNAVGGAYLSAQELADLARRK